MPERKSQQRAGIDVYAKRSAWAIYIAFVLSAVLSAYDRSGASYIETFLGLSFLFSLPLLALALLGLIIVTERMYLSTAKGDNNGLVVLGGGLVIVIIAAMPVLKITDMFFNDLQYKGSYVQITAFLITLFVLFYLNIDRLKSIGKDLAGGPAVCAVLILPLTTVVSLWIVALGKAMYLYATRASDGWLLKAFLELVNGIYLLALIVSGCFIYKLFRRDVSAGV